MAVSQQVQWVDVQDILRGQHTEHVLIAKYIVNIGAVQGGVVNVAAPKNQAADRIRPRRAAPHILPRPVPGFLDRSREQSLVGQALAQRQVVDIHGPDGTGKTALASRAMQAQLPSAFPDGMLYLSARHETREDLLQDIFQGFFQSDDLVKVTENDVRRHMAGKQALIVVDDANLLQDGEAQDLAQVIPRCALLVAAQEQQIWMGTGIALRGLPSEHAVRLFEQHWGPLRANDSATVEAICEALDNIPLNIVKIAATAKQQHLSLDQVLKRLQPRTKERDATPPALALVVSQMSKGERTVLAGLAAAGGPTVGVDALPVITGLRIEEIRQHLIQLQERELIHANSTRCSLNDGLRSYIEQAWTGAEMKARAAGYYLMKAPALQTLPKDPDEENVLSALDYYVEQKQWQQVATMVRSVDRYLATTGHWEQWRRRLEQALQAARRLGDRATEAWVQNQLGVIAMGLGETTVALQLFRSALSIRRALSDRSGALVTRWNLRLLTPPPPTPWDRLVQRLTSLLKSSSLWVPIALTAIATLGLVALLASMTVIAKTGLDSTSAPSVPAATFTTSPTPPVPTISLPPAAEIPRNAEVSLAAGCGETLAPGTDRTIQIRANSAGRVAVYLRDPKGSPSALFEVDVRPGETITQTWLVPDQAGIWALEANLNHGQAHDRCTFAVALPVEPPVQITRVPPSPIPAVNLWLAEGCGRTLRPGTRTLVSFRASVAGQVAVYLASKQQSTQF
ncbi:MAG TPA: NB-ARC domain-containing protein, partial [Anaerolineae bacterium]|nr:NB-ARC domain-containing protein [Anaerolineae bacterium]